MVAQQTLTLSEIVQINYTLPLTIGDVMNTMDKYLKTIAIFLCVYIVIDLIIFCIKGCEPSTLTMYIFIAATGECGFMGWIKTAKEKKQQREWLKEDKNNEHN